MNEIILLVEDSPDDVFFMHYALQQAAAPEPVHVAYDGQEAVDYLVGEGKFADRSRYPLPTIIFLDLKLPLLNGFEVLAWLRQQPALQDIAVFILTGSSEQSDKEQARRLGVSGYMVKPPKPATLREAIQSLHSKKQVSAT